MTTKAHKNLTGVDLHEPKGVSSATSGQVYRADGAGSGVWSTIVIPTGLFTVTFATFAASGTWTKPSNLFKIRVHVIAAGGSDATSGGNVSFGSHCSAVGGVARAGGSAGGTASNGSLNLTGENGQNIVGFCARSGSPWTIYGVGNTSDGVNAGGGAGGYSMKEVVTASLGATETVTWGNHNGLDNGFVLVEQYISV